MTIAVCVYFSFICVTKITLLFSVLVLFTAATLCAVPSPTTGARYVWRLTLRWWRSWSTRSRSLASIANEWRATLGITRSFVRTFWQWPSQRTMRPAQADLTQLSQLDFTNSFIVCNQVSNGIVRSCDVLTRKTWRRLSVVVTELIVCYERLTTRVWYRQTDRQTRSNVDWLVMCLSCRSSCVYV